uniref:Transposase, IS66 family n=1 Tax=Magnetospirillum gryphiswaldense TaxID=55518 RepID=A4U5D9_9PROT|nr:transposase, fragment IS66 family [Magnetospirillum gryphiswaldense MSR-1]
MIPVPRNVLVWLAVGRTDMRRGMNGLALQVQESLKRDPHVGDLFVFRGRSGDMIKIIWHDGLGMSLYAKRLEKGRFIWPSPADGVVAISPAQLAYMLDGIGCLVIPPFLAGSEHRIYDSIGAWRPAVKPHRVGLHRPARQPGPLHRVLALLDVLLRRAPLIVEGDHAGGGPGQIGDDEADAGIQFAGMPFDLGDHAALPAP